jgi:2-polyprenyl-6-methoxyphenol hydroxylase-like FAD-dependent oxidoreductase
MPPSGGLGANTALRDALVLAEALVAYTEGRSSLFEAVGNYEKKMFQYAFPAIDESMKNLRRMKSDNLFMRRVGRVGAKIAGRVMGMNRREGRP